MSITYPLTPPAMPLPKSFKLGRNALVAEVTSPFTAQQQIQEWPGEWFDLEVGLPPMVRSQAEAWVAFLSALRGKTGTFVMGDPLGSVPQGLAATLGSTPQIGLTPSNYDAQEATSGSSAAGSGSYHQWANPGNVASNSAFATVNLALGTASTPLIAGAFGFAIGGFEIAGIEVSLNGGCTNAGPILSLQLSCSTRASLIKQINLPNVIGPLTFGSSSDLWGTTPWLASMINDPTFAVSITAAGAPLGGSTVSVDGVIVTIYFVPGNVAGSKVLYTSGWTANTNGLLLPGDWAQVQASAVGSPLRLHKILTPVNSDAAGNAPIDIFPVVRETLAAGNPVNLFNTVGTFRLAQNRDDWSIDKSRTFGISFKAKEAI